MGVKKYMQSKGNITVVLGLQRGDEGKGRFVDELAQSHDIVARFNGGSNAGHTVVLPDGTELDLHLVPSGIAHSHTINIIGNGCLVDPLKLIKEIDSIKAKGIAVSQQNLKISDSAHVILPKHVAEDVSRESDAHRAQGSTKSGIAQAASEKYARTGKTIAQLLNNAQELDSAPELRDALLNLSLYVTDTAMYLNEQLSAGKKILAEGAQAFLLDIDHGMYPFATSSTTTVGGVCTGLGVAPHYIQRVIGIVKATQSHVGGGPFVTEITDSQLLDQLRGKQGAVDAEFGTTTGRARRMGHLDLPQIKRAITINGVHEIALTKVDCIPRYGNDISICTSYKDRSVAPATADELQNVEPIYTHLPSWAEDISSIRDFSNLPTKAQDYIEFIEQELATPITRIGVGPNRTQVVKK
jgi:adenylosuccinate synthase